MKLEPYDNPPKDLSALQLYDYLRKTVTAGFNCPLSMLDLSSTGGDGSITSESSDTVRRQFQRYCLLPRTERILEALSHALCPPRMALIADTTVSPDKVFELQRITALVAGDIATINEGRIAQGLEPLPGYDKLHSEIAPGIGTPSAQTFQTSYTPPRTKGQRYRYRSTVPNPEALVKALQPLFKSLQVRILGGMVGKSLGRNQWIKPDERGLIAKTQYPKRPANYVGEWLPDFVWEMIAANVLRGKSIGFRVNSGLRRFWLLCDRSRHRGCFRLRLLDWYRRLGWLLNGRDVRGEDENAERADFDFPSVVITRGHLSAVHFVATIIRAVGVKHGLLKLAVDRSPDNHVFGPIGVGEVLGLGWGLLDLVELLDQPAHAEA